MKNLIVSLLCVSILLGTIPSCSKETTKTTSEEEIENLREMKEDIINLRNELLTSALTRGGSTFETIDEAIEAERRKPRRLWLIIGIIGDVLGAIGGFRITSPGPGQNGSSTVIGVGSGIGSIAGIFATQLIGNVKSYDDLLNAKNLNDFSEYYDKIAFESRDDIGLAHNKFCSEFIDHISNEIYSMDIEQIIDQAYSFAQDNGYPIIPKEDFLPIQKMIVDFVNYGGENIDFAISELFAGKIDGISKTQLEVIEIYIDGLSIIDSPEDYFVFTDNVNKIINTAELDGNTKAVIKTGVSIGAASYALWQ